ncbi:high affinity immunoglobulin gamma Fc receptor I-like isoform X6 [Xiphophorus maculatus]|nr:high affinity immunoglobulin gamma Fc receptor I-like isoform X6 [Xiphophorus maculatus]
MRESVTLICEDENRSDGWTVRRNITRGTRKRCEVWGKLNGSTCNMNYLVPYDTGLYWCESMSGSSSSSSSIQLSVSGGSVILQSPVLPVMEGDDVTLSCRAKNPTHNLPAAFYKDGSFIGDETTGNKILNSVKKSDEGLYKCNVKGHGESPSSRISVKERISSTPPSSSTPPPPPPSSLPTISVVVSIFIFLVLLSLILLVLLVRRCFCRKPEAEGGKDGEKEIRDLKTFINQLQPIRSSRGTSTCVLYSARRTDVHQGQIVCRATAAPSSI